MRVMAVSYPRELQLYKLHISKDVYMNMQIQSYVKCIYEHLMPARVCTDGHVHVLLITLYISRQIRPTTRDVVVAMAGIILPAIPLL